jgi:hypothetical protein
MIAVYSENGMKHMNILLVRLGNPENSITIMWAKCRACFEAQVLLYVPPAFALKETAFVL